MSLSWLGGAKQYAERSIRYLASVLGVWGSYMAGMILALAKVEERHRDLVEVGLKRNIVASGKTLARQDTVPELLTVPGYSSVRFAVVDSISERYY